MLSFLFISVVFIIYLLNNRKFNDNGWSLDFKFTPKNLIGLGIVIGIAIVLFLI